MRRLLCCKRGRGRGHVYRIYIVDAGIDMCMDVYVGVAMCMDIGVDFLSIFNPKCFFNVLLNAFILLVSPK